MRMPLSLKSLSFMSCYPLSVPPWAAMSAPGMENLDETDANLYENVVRHRLAAPFRSVDPLAGDARSHRRTRGGGRLRARGGRDPGLGSAPALAAGGRRQVGRWRGDPRFHIDELHAV